MDKVDVTKLLEPSIEGGSPVHRVCIIFCGFIFVFGSCIAASEMYALLCAVLSGRSWDSVYVEICPFSF